MTSLDEIYREVRECAAGLRASGRVAPGDAIEDALYGSTSGEIPADVGARVQRALRSERNHPTDLRGRLESLLRAVDRVLRASGRG